MIKISRASVFYTALILGGSNILLQGIGFIYRIFLTDMIGTEGLGVYKLTIQIYSVLLTTCTAGVCLVSTNKSAEYFAKGDISSLRKMIKCCILIFGAIFLVCASIVIIFPELLATYILGDVNSKNALYIILVCILFTGVENIIKSSLIGIKKVKYTAFSEITEQILRIIIVLFLIYNFSGGDYKKSAFLIVLGMTISEIFSVVFLGLVFQKTHKTKRKISNNMIMSIAKVALPISFAAVLNNIISSASVVILPSRLILAGFTREQALSELGVITGVLMPILILPIAIVSSYAIVVMPSISKSKSIANYSDIERKINKSFEATGFIGVALTVSLSYMAIPVGEIFFNTSFPKAYVIMITIAVIFLYYQIVTASILNGLGLERTAIFHSVIGEVLQLIFTIILCAVPNINIFGYLFGMAISPIVVSILNITYIFDNYKFRTKKFVVLPLCITLFLYVVIKILYTNFVIYFGNEVLTICLVLGIGSVIYMIILRIFGINFVQYIVNLNVKNNKINYNKDFIF